MLKFSPANAKTTALYNVAELTPYLQGKRKVYSLDLPAGHTCPGADLCKSMVVLQGEKHVIQDGPSCQFRCFTASQEVVYSNTRKARQHNLDCLTKMRGAEQCMRLMRDSLPANCGIVRFHVSGDFFKLAYLQGAIALAAERPDVLFYGYTKSLNFLRRITDWVDPSNGVVRNNFLLTVSEGGKFDSLIPQLGVRTAKVVYSEAETNGLPIDHDDSHAATKGGSFALLLHGVQPAGSEASKALSALKGKGSYARK